MKNSTPSSLSVEFNPEEFILIARSELLAVNLLPTDIFLKISDTKLLLIGRQGSASLDDLHVLENKNVDSFYIRKSEYKNCVGQNLLVAGIVVNKKDVSEQKKVEFLGLTALSVFKEIENIGFNQESLEHSRAVSKSIQSLISTKSDLHGVISLIGEVSDELLRHSMAVSAVSVMIAKSMGWTVQVTLEKLALGGLLHDIGMKELPKDLLNKARHEMTFEERQQYETHVQRGVEILSTMPSVSEEVIAIALEHHENAIAQGYPRRIRDFKMNPFARIVSLADCFCELTLKNVDHPVPKSAIEAIEYIEVTLGQPYSKPAFMALKQALKGVMAPPGAGSIKVVA